MVGKSDSHVKNSAEFAKLMKTQCVEDGEELCSYDITALFISAPVDKVVVCIRRVLEVDNTLQERTNMSLAKVCTPGLLPELHVLCV